MRKIILVLIFCFAAIMLWAQEPKLVLPIGHISTVYSAQFNRDGKKIITASKDKTVKLWDAKTGSLLADMTGYTDEVYYAEFSHDGKRIVTAPRDGTGKIWDASKGTFICDLRGHQSQIRDAQFSPDDKKIVTASYDKTAKLWDAETGKMVVDLMGHKSLVNSAKFSPDGEKIITASDDSTAKIWNAKTGKIVVDLKGHMNVVYFAQFSPDCKKIITASDDSTAKIWDAETGQIILNLKNNRSIFNSVQFSPDGKKIVTSSTDSTFKLWDADSGKILAELIGHTGTAYLANFSPDGQKIITASSDTTVKVWNAASGKLLVNISGHENPVRSAQFSPDGKSIATASNDWTAKVWDAQSGKIKADLTGHTMGKMFAQFSRDGKNIITPFLGNTSGAVWDATLGTFIEMYRGIFIENVNEYSPDGIKVVLIREGNTADILNTNTGDVILKLKGHADKINSAQFSSDGKKIVTSSDDKTVKIWNAISGSIIFDLKGYEGEVSFAKFSADSKKVLTICNSTAKIWDANTGKSLKNSLYQPFLESAEFSSDNKKIITIGRYDSARIWNAVTGNLLFTICIGGSHDEKRNSYTSYNNNLGGFSFDGKKIITLFYEDNKVKVWDALTGRLIADLKGQKNNYISAAISPNSNQLVTTAEDNTCKLWDANSGNLLYTFFPLDGTNYFGQNPSGYYQTTAAAAKLLHYVTEDLKVITFEQLDVKYNRPDKVLQAIGSTDTALIKSYRKAYEKRIKKLGIDTTAFRSGYSVPEADFTNRDKIEFEQKDGKLKLDIKSYDSTYKLDRLNVWINETPIFGQRGISLRNNSINNFDSSLSINLSQGENRIEASITNVNGTESYRMPLLVNYTPATKQTEKTYFIGIGIDQFVDSKYNLKYSTKDIRDLSKKLKEKYSNLIIDTLFNEHVTISNVKLLKQKLLQTSVNDKVIISYSGHGMLSKDFDYYLSTYAVNFDKPEENGLPYDELESLLDSIPARKKLLLIDACHSGEVDKDDLIALEATDKKLIKGLKPVAYKTGGHLGLKNSFELMQSLFVNVGKSTGATIISAAAGTQFALEGVNNLLNGVFTYSILEAMNKYPSMKISELKKIVGERVVEITKGLQKPTSRNETIAVDWKLWEVK